MTIQEKLAFLERQDAKTSAYLCKFLITAFEGTDVPHRLIDKGLWEKPENTEDNSESTQEKIPKTPQNKKTDQKKTQ
jgi:hypothetical protein